MKFRLVNMWRDRCQQTNFYRGWWVVAVGFEYMPGGEYGMGLGISALPNW